MSDIIHSVNLYGVSIIRHFMGRGSDTVPALMELIV